MRTAGMTVLFILCAALACLAVEIPGPMSGTFVHDYAGVIPVDKSQGITRAGSNAKRKKKGSKPVAGNAPNYSTASSYDSSSSSYDSGSSYSSDSGSSYSGGSDFGGGGSDSSW